MGKLVSGRLSDKEKEIIENLRNENKSYTEIAVILNSKKDRIKRYCQIKNLGGFKSGDYRNPINSFETFINNFNNKFGNNYIYISGFEGSESTILIECKKCKKQFTRNAQLARKNKQLVCSNCNKIRNEALLIVRNAQKELDNLIKKIKNNIRNEIEKIEDKLKKLDIEYTCDECGEIFTSTRTGIKYCSDKCLKKRNNRVKELMRRKKIFINGSVDRDISLEKLIKRDNNTCYLCGDECDTNDYTKDANGSFIVGKKYPSIEHVIPISKGGTHSWDNVKLAHHYCNTIKRDNIHKAICKLNT